MNSDPSPITDGEGEKNPAGTTAGISGRIRASVWRRLLLIAVTTAVSLGFTISLPFVFTSTVFKGTGTENRWAAIAIVLFALVVVPLAVACSVIASIAVPFGTNIAWQKRVYLVVVGFLAMILTYTGVYFYIAAAGDYSQAASSNIYFQIPPGSGWEYKSREDLLLILQDRREFKGMNHYLFLAIHEDPKGSFRQERKYLTAQQIMKMAQDEKQREPRLDSGATRGLLGDCFHFSVATAATVGYGDITPVSSFARFVTDTQILASVGILVFGLGFVMSSRGVEDEDKQPQA